MMYIRAHNTPHGDIVAVCDKDLLGKRLAEGKLQLDLEKYRDFYNGSLRSEADAKKEIAKFHIYTANVVGKESVKVFIELGLATKEDVRMVQGVPFLHTYKMDAL